MQPALVSVQLQRLMFLHRRIIYLQGVAAHGASYMVMMNLLAGARLKDVIVPVKMK
jgi:hypothetical protein